MTEPKRHMPTPFTLYYGAGRFLFLAQHLHLDSVQTLTRRPTASVIIGLDGPFQVDFAEQPPFQTRALLIAPNTAQRQLHTLDSGLAIFDIPQLSPLFDALRPALHQTPLTPLQPGQYEPLLPQIRQAVNAGLSCSQVDALFQDLVEALSAHLEPGRALNPRVKAALEMMEDLPFADATLIELAQRVHLSPSRLRHLFREATGCTFSQYRRWSAVWKAIEMVARHRPCTTIAHTSGFYDLSHFDRAFREIFGIGMSAAINFDTVSVRRCHDWWLPEAGVDASIGGSECDQEMASAGMNITRGL